VPPTYTPTPTPAKYQGCTPGYWKQSQHFDSWSTYAPTTLVRNVFNISAYLSNGILDLNGDGQDDSLLDALNYQGGNGLTGGARILLRAAVAALLNASNPSMNFTLASSQVIAQVNAALASGNRSTQLALANQLDRYNNADCPLN
jgi:hypothetical protein